MIKTVADLLRGLMGQELEVLDGFPLRHAPTIGAMYEGLSAEILSRTIPSSLDLRVVSGFIVDDGDGISGQIDCMLVVGGGTSVPYTDDYLWHIKDVISVFEVKKNLHSAEISDAISHLQEVKELHRRYLDGLGEGESPGFTLGMTRALERAFAETTGIAPPPFGEIERLPWRMRLIHHAILAEIHAPMRVVIGFHGFKAEHGLRKSIYDYMSSHAGTPGHGVGVLPRLIISGDYSFVKCSGEPFNLSLVQEDWWPFCFTTEVNPILLLLESLWTRLQMRFDIVPDWGEDLEMEVPHAFLLARGAGAGVEEVGWELSFVNPKADSLQGLKEFTSWEPTELSLSQFVVVSRLVQEGRVRVDDRGLADFVRGQGVESFEDVVADLIKTRLVAKTIDGELVLVTEECQTMILPDGRYIAAENNTGRLTRWHLRQVAQRRDDPPTA